LQQLGVEASATWLSKRVTPTTVPDEAVSSPCSFLESAFTLQQQLQQLGEGPSVACLPKMTAPIHVPGEIGPSPCNSFQSNFALQQQPNLLEERTSTIGLPESTTLTTVTDEVKSFPCSSSGLPDRTTSITVADEAGSSPCSTFESAYMFQMQPVEKGTSATCLPEKTIPTPGPNIVGSSPCTSFARACMSRSQQCQLGRGASATVYKVSRFGRWVAKKVFFGLDHPEFENEVSILKPLSNPNIMSLLDSGKEKDSCYILMELMDCDLLQLLERLLEQNCDSFPFTIAEAVDIMLQLAEGMKYLHENKIVHGDLKSPNILIKILENECVDARVGDFGLAKTNKKSRTYSDQEYNLGTDRWMAPELIKFPSRGGDQVNAPGFEKPLKYPYKIDVHSFAVICSEILTGERPFPTIGSSKEVKQKVLNGDRPDLPDHCPKRLKYLIERCWDEDPSKRPTFAEICKELKQISNQLRATGMSCH